jgi:hypothetical protein
MRFTVLSTASLLLKTRLKRRPLARHSIALSSNKAYARGRLYPFGVGRLSNFEQARDAAQLSRLYERG